MFWKKKSDGESLPGPKDIPEIVGRHLVVALKQDPDWVWRLKGVLRPYPENKDMFDFRVFDDGKTQAKNVKIKNYDSFNEFPDLILYEGWLNKKTMQVQLKEKPAKTSAN